MAGMNELDLRAVNVLSIIQHLISLVAQAIDKTWNSKPVKPDRNHGSKRIDGIVAAIMAIGRESLRGRTESVYENRGLP